MNTKENNCVTEDDDDYCFELSYSEIYIYNNTNIFMVSWWETDSYLNNEHIQIGDIEIMTATYGSSGSFG